MSRIRSIKPEFWASEQIGECSTNARLLFVGLWNFADDNGIHPAKPLQLKAEVFPFDAFTRDDVRRWIDELLAVGLLREYSVESETYWIVTGWSKHQKIDRPSTKYPLPLADDSPNIRRGLDEDSLWKGVESSRVESKGVESIPPDAGAPPATQPAPAESRKVPMPADFGISERVKRWADEHGHRSLDLHLEHFRGYAKANGAKFLDWDEAFMNSIRSNFARVPMPASRANETPRERIDREKRETVATLTGADRRRTVVAQDGELPLQVTHE